MLLCIEQSTFIKKKQTINKDNKKIYLIETQEDLNFILKKKFQDNKIDYNQLFSLLKEMNASSLDYNKLVHKTGVNRKFYSTLELSKIL